jgi:hypothetical protein
MAAALAETGRYPEARETASRAADAAQARGDASRVAAIRERMALYAAGRPYREGAVPR